MPNARRHSKALASCCLKTSPHGSTVAEKVRMITDAGGLPDLLKQVNDDALAHCSPPTSLNLMGDSDCITFSGPETPPYTGKSQGDQNSPSYWYLWYCYVYANYGAHRVMLGLHVSEGWPRSLERRGR
eukprot:TRINITY_DN44588_c0_g1_i1.p1 TRINITY_DN44588_c0_g1~~TRINITY_DN44588_c0_g1_i1.p1  ORF type:complete len:144 (-),score=3.62 TRINITY_DN44588_c0_g1_i1:83-466(-)